MHIVRASALSYANHFTDNTDPSFLVMEPDSQADLLARLRFSTYTLIENEIRPLTDQELTTTVSSLLDLRPDSYAIHQKGKRLAILEFTRAMDSSEDWEEKKDAEKRSRYAPVLEILQLLAGEAGVDYEPVKLHGWVRGSFSNVDRTESLSFKCIWSSAPILFLHEQIKDIIIMSMLKVSC